MKNSVLSPWKGAALIGSMAISLFLTACGDDITNNEVLKAESYSSKEDLPDCGEKYEGKFATIPSKGEVYVCADGKWNSLLNKAAATISDDGDFACSTVELSSGKGYKVVCGGDSVAVLTNGTKGATGDKGPKGSTGESGEDGKSGSSGSDGKDLSLKAGDCAVMNYGTDYVVYDCGDSVYVKGLSSSKASLDTWNALNVDPKVKVSGSNVATFSTAFLSSPVANTSEGKLERWDEDPWVDYADVTAEELSKNFAIKGKATLEIKEGAKAYDYMLIEPSVGAGFQFLSARDISLWGGFCLTYESEKDMELVVMDDTFKKLARASLKASTKETTVDILYSALKPDSANVELEDIFVNAMGVFVKVVGSLKVGKYQNTFAIYELGAYGRCDGKTINDVEAWAKKTAKAGSPLVDDRADPENPVTYKTVTIGEQTWMAENLRLPYPSKTDDGDGDPETDDGAPMILCPATEEDLVAKGCLYRWSAVMDSVGLYNEASVYQDEEGSDVALKHCGNGKACALTAPVKGICPDGWHVPTSEEVEVLLKTAKFDENYPGVSVAALAAEGANWLGFSAVGSGYTSDYSTTSSGRFVTWLATEASANAASYLYWSGGSTDPFQIFGDVTKTYGFAVRCIKDQAKE